jgi:hypothetical protein
VLVDAEWQFLEHVPELAAARIHLRSFWRQMQPGPGGLVGQEEYCSAENREVRRLLDQGLEPSLLSGGDGSRPPRIARQAT